METGSRRGFLDTRIICAFSLCTRHQQLEMAPAVSDLVRRVLAYSRGWDPYRLAVDFGVQNRAYASDARHLWTDCAVYERKPRLDQRRDVRKPTPRACRILDHNVVP